jgi:imidazole glycerol-phosphate synthase subunit HisH
MMHVILDYDVGNLASVQKAFEVNQMKAVISKDPNVIKNADSLILPGVGAFKEAMSSLKQSNLIPLIQRHIELNKPILGICLGMQLLYETSEEDGIHQGLGFLKGHIVKFDQQLKVPHMGWNQLKIYRNHPILKYTSENDEVYFVHSYYVKGDSKDLISYTNYGVLVPAIVQSNQIFATQFHPEKSGQVGLNIIKAFGELTK